MPPREPRPVRDLSEFERRLGDFTMAELRAASRIIGRIGRQRVESVPNMRGRGRSVEEQLDVMSAPEFEAEVGRSGRDPVHEAWVLDQLRGPLTRTELTAWRPSHLTADGVEAAIQHHIEQGVIEARMVGGEPQFQRITGGEGPVVTFAPQQAHDDWVLRQVRGEDFTWAELRAQRPVNMSESGIDEAVRSHVRTGALRSHTRPDGIVVFSWAAREAADQHLAEEGERLVMSILAAEGPYTRDGVARIAAFQNPNMPSHAYLTVVDRLLQMGALQEEEDGGIRVVEGPVLEEDVRHEDWVMQQLRTGGWLPWTSLYDVEALRPAHLNADGVWHALERLVRRGDVLARMGPDDVEQYALPREDEAAVLALDPDGDRPTLLDERRADAAVLHQVLYRPVLTIDEVSEALMRDPNPSPVGHYGAEHYEAAIQRLIRQGILGEDQRVLRVRQPEAAQALLDPDRQEERIRRFVQWLPGVARRDEVARRLTDESGGSFPPQSILQTIQRLIERGVLIEREALANQHVLYMGGADLAQPPTAAPLSEEGELRQRILELVGDGGRRKERIVGDLMREFDGEPACNALDLMILGGALTEREGRVWPKGAVLSVPEPLDALDQILADD